MKNLILLIFTFLMFVCVSATVEAQPGHVYTAESAYAVSATPIYTGDVVISRACDMLTIQGLCTEIKDTDGYLILQGSVDGTSYKNLSPVANLFVYYPNNDTLTMVAGAIQQVIIFDNPFNFYRWKVTGTANDSTLVSTTYVYKLK